ncbi:RNA polymerase sigma-70 factor [Labilithrix luteola]|uniref:RNA polymerase sigma-70 factor n=1 Tax=Labilithrix luteola TaxID=1391654 RepID=A0A0K1Q3C8_9BACT|nr:RNA polymerase sigma-70 factor [Labilithrix luteola]
MGSIADAEDVLQETWVRAWQAFDRFDEHRASLRTWLHRIATNACLNALEGRRHRPLPSGLGLPPTTGDAPLARGVDDIPWLEPIPDALFGTSSTDPAQALLARGHLRLAVVAATQLLPPRQRAILLLREVLDVPATDVAEALETTVAAVNSGLQRARAQLNDAQIGPDDVLEPTAPERRALVEKYVAAFERADIAALRELLTEEALLEMPPFAIWLRGRADYARFVERVFEMRGHDWRVAVTAANGQFAFAAYVASGNGTHTLHTLQVLDVTPRGISRNVVFQDPRLMQRFGLSPTFNGEGGLKSGG